MLEKSNIGCAREKYVDAFWQPFESRVPQGCEQVVQDRLCCVEVLLRVCSAVSAISTLATSALTAENRGSSKTTMSLEADLQRTSPKRRDLTQMRTAGMSAIASAFGGVSGPDADIAKSTRLMLWTAPPAAASKCLRMGGCVRQRLFHEGRAAIPAVGRSCRRTVGFTQGMTRRNHEIRADRLPSFIPYPHGGSRMMAVKFRPVWLR